VIEGVWSLDFAAVVGCLSYAKMLADGKMLLRSGSKGRNPLRRDLGPFIPCHWLLPSISFYILVFVFFLDILRPWVLNLI